MSDDQCQTYNAVGPENDVTAGSDGDGEGGGGMCWTPLRNKNWSLAALDRERSIEEVYVQEWDIEI